MNGTTLFSHFLEALQVPHTAEYSDKAYRSLPFRSCFGLKKLLGAYGVESEGLMLGDKSEIAKLPTPFLAKTPRGFVIVTEVSPTEVSYVSQGQTERAPRTDFLNGWTGMFFSPTLPPNPLNPTIRSTC